jgi:purine-binding chemotaxis protein CheW
METPDKLVVSNLDDRRFAMPLSAVVRVERIVAITPLPKAPEIVLGVINMHGQVIPVREKGFKFAA